jgi:hypothetical protein
VKGITILVSTVALAVFGYAAIQRTERTSSVQAESHRQTSAVVDAANAFLKALSPDQRHNVQFAFTPQKSGTIVRFHRTANGGVAPSAPAGGADGFGQGPPGGFVGEQYGSAIWSNYPVSDVLRPGLRLGTLTVPQREAAMHLLQILLSPMGYQKVREIMGSDQALTNAGTNFASGEAVYTIGIFGTPSPDKPWMIEFGGHHLGLNVVIAGSQGVMTPTLIGAQPAIY